MAWKIKGVFFLICTESFLKIKWDLVIHLEKSPFKKIRSHKIDAAQRRWQYMNILPITYTEWKVLSVIRLTMYFCKKNSFAEFIYMREITTKLHSFKHNDNMTFNPITRKNRHLRSLCSTSEGEWADWLFQNYCSQTLERVYPAYKVSIFPSQ